MQASVAPAKRVWPFGLLVFVLVFGIHVSSGFIQGGGDTHWALNTTVSIIHDRNLDLNEYPAELEQFPVNIRTVDGKVYNYFPYGTSVLITPIVATIDMGMRITTGEHLDMVMHTRRPWAMDRFIASLLIAGAALLVLLYCVRLTRDRRISLILALIFAFATSAWSVGSRGLWMQAPMMFVYALAIYLFAKAKDRPIFGPFLGVTVAFCYVVRPTAVVPIVIFSAYIVLKLRKLIFGYFAGAAVVAAAFFATNLASFGKLLPPYYDSSRLGDTPHFWEALAGNLISPARGLFMFSPVLLLAFVGVYLLIKQKRFNDIYLISALTIIGHWLVISRIEHWWGGASFGPRLMSDVMPFFVVLLIPVLQKIMELNKSQLRYAAAGVFATLFAVSIAFHAPGATTQAANDWNKKPAGIDENPDRLWDWGDPPFLRWQ